MSDRLPKFDPSRTGVFFVNLTLRLQLLECLPDFWTRRVGPHANLFYFPSRVAWVDEYGPLGLNLNAYLVSNLRIKSVQCWVVIA